MRVALRFSRRTGGESKSELKVNGQPLGVDMGQLMDPAAQVGTQVLNFASPHLGDGGRQFFLPILDDLVVHLVCQIHHALVVSSVDGQQIGCLHRTEEFELHLVEKAAARQRIQPFDGRDFIAFAKPVNRLQKKTIRTDGVVLQGGGRIAACPQPVFLEDAQRAEIRFIDAICFRPLPVPTRPTSAQRTSQHGARFHQVRGFPFDLF